MAVDCRKVYCVITMCYMAYFVVWLF